MSSILSKAMFPAAVAIAMLGFIGALGTGSVRTAHAIEGDVCRVYTNATSTDDFDGQGNTVHLVNRDVTYGVVFRIEDDDDLNLLSGPEAQPVAAIQTEEEATEEEEAEEASEEEATEEEEAEEASEEEATEEDEASEEGDEESSEEDGIEEASEDEEEAEAELQQIELLQEDLDFDLTGENTEVRIDSETGSARITGKAEILTLEEQEREIPDSEIVETLDVPNVGHSLINPGVGSQVLDTISPRFFNDPDGNPLDDIGDWLEDAGYPDFVGEEGDDPDVCGDDIAIGTLEDCPPEEDCSYTKFLDDSWGFFAFECIEAGYFHIDIMAPDDTEETGQTLKFFCGGQAETAEISASPETVEIYPVGDSVSSSIVTVAVEDQFGDRIDGVEVTFITDNCRFSNPNADDEDDFGISPAGGGQTVTVLTDTDSTSDDNFLEDNPLEHAAGTAEVSLDCATGTPGTAQVTAIVQRPGSDIVLREEIRVIGPTAVSGLALVVSPEMLKCGETVQARATAVDETGSPVSDGTPILFTTDTSSGVVGGTEGAQGGVTTVNGEASVLIATDPGNPGIHTVIAYTMGPAGVPNAQVSRTYECEATVAPVLPPAPPSTGTGSITPPSTGDAGLASGSGNGLPVIVLALSLVAAGLATIRPAVR